MNMFDDPFQWGGSTEVKNGSLFAPDIWRGPPIEWPAAIEQKSAPNPFAKTHPDPFSSSKNDHKKAAPDPFAPFASGSSASTAALDPFAPVSEHKKAKPGPFDPFAQGDGINSDPFAKSNKGTNPFNDPFNDPFKIDAKKTKSDPFADAGWHGDGKATKDPFPSMDKKKPKPDLSNLFTQANVKSDPFHAPLPTGEKKGVSFDPFDTVKSDTKDDNHQSWTAGLNPTPPTTRVGTQEPNLKWLVGVENAIAPAPTPIPALRIDDNPYGVDIENVPQCNALDDDEPTIIHQPLRAMLGRPRRLHRPALPVYKPPKRVQSGGASRFNAEAILGHELNRVDAQLVESDPVLPLHVPDEFVFPSNWTVHADSGPVPADPAAYPLRLTNLTVEAKALGRIRWHGSVAIDHPRLILDAVSFAKQRVTLYPNAATPPRGQDLNRPADISVFGIKGRGGAAKVAAKLRKLCARQGAEFVDYNAERFVYTFRVEGVPEGTGKTSTH